MLYFCYFWRLPGPLADDLRKKGITIVIGGYPFQGVPSIYRVRASFRPVPLQNL